VLGRALEASSGAGIELVRVLVGGDGSAGTADLGGIERALERLERRIDRLERRGAAEAEPREPLPTRRR
jgi:hypothetical protein